jgi:hypothetical protein
VLGSNVFNLAAMIGLSALLAGRVRLAREALLFEGTAALLVSSSPRRSSCGGSRPPLPSP